MFKFSKLITLILLLLVGIGGFTSITLYQKNKQDYLKGSNILYKDGDVLGISTDKVEVSVDFNQQISAGSPLIFGGAHSPKLNHPKAWDEIAAAGVTEVRSDFFLDRYLPSKITLDQYKQNYNNVQDPKTWNQEEINKVKGIYQEAHKRNMKTMGIMAYSISWLNYSQNHYGVPMDWAVYEDLVAKTYRLFRSDVDYLEIWNEPDLDFFMNTKNSGLDKATAYQQIAQHAIKAIREVDAQINDGKRIKLGVGVMSQPANNYILDKVLSDKSISSQVDFVSYHNYEHLPEPSYTPIKDVLKKYDMTSTPIFLTEWSHTPNIKQSDMMVLSDQAIPYSASKFIDFLNMGLMGANYFSLQPIMVDSPRGDEGLLGIYNVKGNSVSMLPIIKTWRLMSKSMGLGDGSSKIYKADGNGEKVVAWNNSKGEYGFVISNEGLDVKEYTFAVNNIPHSGSILLNAYMASGSQNGQDVVGTAVVNVVNNKTAFKAIVPGNSVLGIKVNKASWKDKLPF